MIKIEEKCKGIDDDIELTSVNDGYDWALIEDINGIEWVQECNIDQCVVCKRIRYNNIKVLGRIELVTGKKRRAERKYFRKM